MLMAPKSKRDTLKEEMLAASMKYMEFSLGMFKRAAEVGTRDAYKGAARAAIEAGDAAMELIEKRLEEISSINNGGKNGSNNKTG